MPQVQIPSLKIQTASVRPSTPPRFPKFRFTDVMRWLGRGGSIISIGLLCLFAFSGGNMPTWGEWIAIALFPGGVAVGMILGWWRERLGALVSLISLGLFFAWFSWLRGSMVIGPYFLVFALPAVCFLFAGRPRGSAAAA